jgi:hypothetical protein
MENLQKCELNKPLLFIKLPSLWYFVIVTANGLTPRICDKPVPKAQESCARSMRSYLPVSYLHHRGETPKKEFTLIFHPGAT